MQAGALHRLGVSALFSGDSFVAFAEFQRRTMYDAFEQFMKKYPIAVPDFFSNFSDRIVGCDKQSAT